MVALVESDPNYGRDIVLLDPGDRTTRRLLTSVANESAPAISPDGQWIALVSDQSGRDEVYVTPINGPARLVKVSADGGAEPVWQRDGTELFFRSGGKMMAAAVRRAPALTVQPARALFQGTFESGAASRPAYDISKDGARFLMVANDTSERRPQELRVVLGWMRRPEPAR
jgi:Tol biopolymer transport system component